MYSFQDSDRARKAGMKSRRGKAKRSEEWLLLRDAILNKHTKKFNKILAGLEGKEFLKIYLEILKYFKPRLSNIEVEPPLPEPEETHYFPLELTNMSNEQLINEIKQLENDTK